MRYHFLNITNSLGGETEGSALCDVREFQYAGSHLTSR